MDLVQPLRAKLLKSIGKSSYKNRDDFYLSLHPSFGGKYSNKDIPDAHLFLDQKTKWNALIEVKIKKSELTIDQLEKYLERVLENKFDALITISNELCATPQMPPLRLKASNKRHRKVEHLHWSWRFIQAEVKNLIRNRENLTAFEYKLLEQFSQFLTHRDSSVRGFTQMPSNWTSFVSQVKDGGRPDIETCGDMTSAWFQETA